jgi:hypothetical protein
MKRIDLQLFALNTKQSVVDYLKSQGQDSSMAARKEIAKNLGISNYSGTYEQNVQMLKALQGGSQNQTSTPKASAPSANVAGSTKTSINGVDQATIDKMNSTYQQSDAVKNANAEADALRNKVKEMASVTDIIDQSTWDAINTKFSASSAYNDAMNYTNGLLQQLSSGKTSYSDQIDALIKDIQNREDFEYDVDSDVLFQQALGSAMASGKTAMMDTMGQASALTGGYGSTYATSAANQQYNAYIQDAYNNLPEYYQMALEAYQMEGEEMYNQLSMLNQADATEYQRLYDAWNANFNNAQSMYEREYGAWQDSVNNAYNSANLQLNEYGQLFDQTYNAYTAVQNNANTLYAQEYQSWADQVNNAFNFAGLANSDYWSTQNFIEDQRQFNANLTQRQNEFSAEMDYKNRALEQDNKQFLAKQAQDNAQFYASQAAKKNADSSSNTVSGSEINQKYYSGALDAYNERGTAGLNEYLGSLNGTLDESQLDILAEYAGYHGNAPLNTIDWEMIDDGGWNWGFGIDNNGKVSDGYNTYSLEQLYEMLQDQGMSSPEAKDYITKLQKKLGITW